MNKYLFENDYSTDSLRWMRFIEEKRFKENALTKKEIDYNLEDFDSIQDEITQNKDSAFAYFFAAQFAYKSYKMQKIILEQKDAK